MTPEYGRIPTGSRSGPLGHRPGGSPVAFCLVVFVPNAVDGKDEELEQIHGLGPNDSERAPEAKPSPDHPQEALFLGKENVHHSYALCQPNCSVKMPVSRSGWTQRNGRGGDHFISRQTPGDCQARAS